MAKRRGSIRQNVESLDFEEIARDRKTAKARRGRFWRPENGKNVIRILPFEHEGETLLYVVQRRHFGVHPDYPVLPCYGKNCPICALRSHLDEETGRSLRPREHYLMNIVDRGNEDAGVQVFGAPVTVWEDIVDLVLDEDYRGILDRETGRDIIIMKTGSGLETKYKVRPGVRDSKVSPDLQPRDLVALVESQDRVSLEQLQQIAESLVETLGIESEQKKSRKRR